MNKIKLNSWGKFTDVDASQYDWKNIQELKTIITSNKSFIEHLTGAPLNERIPGSIASVLATYQKGAHIFRVHNVKEIIQAFDVFKAINE